MAAQPVINSINNNTSQTIRVVLSFHRWKQGNAFLYLCLEGTPVTQTQGEDPDIALNYFDRFRKNDILKDQKPANATPI